MTEKEVIDITINMDDLIRVYIDNSFTKRPYKKEYWFDCHKQELRMELIFFKDE